MPLPITFTGRGVIVTDAMKSFIEGHLEKLPHIDMATHINCEVGQAMSHRGVAKDFSVRFLITLPRAQVRLRKDGSEVYALVEDMTNRLKTKMVQYKENFRKWEGSETWPEAHIIDEAAQSGIDEGVSYAGYIPKVKRKVITELPPMSVTEAIERMELLDKEYFIFKDVQSGTLSVVAKKGNEYEVVVTEK